MLHFSTDRTAAATSYVLCTRGVACGCGSGMVFSGGVAGAEDAGGLGLHEVGDQDPVLADRGPVLVGELREDAHGEPIGGRQGDTTAAVTGRRKKSMRPASLSACSLLKLQEVSRQSNTLAHLYPNGKLVYTASTMRNVLALIFIFISAIGLFFLFRPEGAAQSPQPEVVPMEDNAPAAPVRVLQSYTIQEGDTFATAVEQFGIGYSDMLEIVSTSQELYDFTNVRLGRDIRYEVQNGEVVYLEYDIDTEEIVVVEKNNGAYTARKEPIAYAVEEVVAGGTIHSSLFVDGNAAGLSDALILEMADILGWTIDFATEVQQGDSFTVFFEKRKRNGQDAPHGRVFAVAFTNGGVEHRGYLFPDAEGKARYYNEEGNSMVRQFLKAPLRYSRITSGFSYARFHPVIGRNTAHLAIDYAAPLGTPILATADGTVTYAAWNGGFGNYIDIRHNGTYATQYAHLSSYAKGIKPGAKVSQGDVIGYVGSTGWSTGPHLHYQIKKNGTLVNPLTIELPAGDPVTQEERPEFERIKATYAARLDQ